MKQLLYYLCICMIVATFARVTTEAEKWSTYRVSVDEIEKRTGLDFFSKVPAGIQSTI